MTTKKKSATKASKSITIGDKTFIPVNLETEFTLADQNFATEFVTDHMRIISSLRNEVLNSDIDTSKSTEEIAETADVDTITEMLAGMGKFKLDPELLALVYKNTDKEQLTREEKTEYFRKMTGLQNRAKVLPECANFISIILKITPDVLSIYSIAESQIVTVA